MMNYGVTPDKDSYVFPSVRILLAMERGDFTPGPILKSVTVEDIDDESVSRSLNMTMSKSWVNEELKKIFSVAVPGYREEGRKFGTHTGRKSFILNALLRGQLHRGPDGQYSWGEVDLDDLCKTIRMVESTVKSYYVGKTKTTELKVIDLYS